MKIIQRFDSSDLEPGDATQIEYELDADGNPVFKSAILIKGGAALWPELVRRHEQAQDNDCPLLLTDLLPEASL